MTDLLHATPADLKRFIECLLLARVDKKSLHRMGHVTHPNKHNKIAEAMREALMQHPACTEVRSLFGDIVQTEWMNRSELMFSFVPILPRPRGPSSKLKNVEIGDFLYEYAVFLCRLSFAGFTVEVIREVNRSEGNMMAMVLAHALRTYRERVDFSAWLCSFTGYYPAYSVFYDLRLVS